MFCRNCGNELPANVKFCPHCGTPVEREEYEQGPNVTADKGPEAAYEQGPEVTYEQGPEVTSEKKAWKDYLTFENIERYAPAAALLPFVGFVVFNIVGGILTAVLGWIPVVEILLPFLLTVLKALFIALAAASTVALTYIAVKKKNVSNVWTWVTPATTLLATVACCGAFGGGNIFSSICGIVAIVLGIERVALVSLGAGQMDVPVNPGEAVNVYKSFIQRVKDYNEAQKAAKQTASANNAAYNGRTVLMDPNQITEESYFDGTGGQLIGYYILGGLIITVTCGIAAPWIICKIYGWRLSHTVINGKRLSFDGKGGSLFGKWILWLLLSIITCGIYTYFMHVALKKWELSHTYIDGEAIAESSFDGNSFEYFGYGLLCGLLVLVTCGLGTPWAICILQKWETSHSIIEGRRLKFSGTGMGFFGQYIIIALLTLITCGIYSAWGTVRLNRYIIAHTDFE